MNTIGLILLLLAGFAQGTFGLGMKKQAPMSWEAFWLYYSFFGMLLIPILCGYFSFGDYFESIISSQGDVLFKSFGLGFLWGIGGILFGKSVAYVGISITNGVVMGLAGGLGAIIPLFGISGITRTNSFIIVVVGVAIMLLGVYISAYSGLLREKEQKTKSTDAVTKKNNLKKGLVIVILSGILSSLLNVGFEAAMPIVQTAKGLGASEAASAIPSRSVVIFGGFLMNALYALYLLFKNNSWKDLQFNKTSLKLPFMWSFITGLLWFMPLGLSGVVAVSIGQLGNIITWPVMLSLSLIFGNIWGYLTGEWKNTKYSFYMMILASIILIAACMILTFKDQILNII